MRIKALNIFCWLFLVVYGLHAQSEGQWGVCEFANLTALNAFDPSANNWKCKLAYVQENKGHYEWNGYEWKKLTTRTIYSQDDTLTSNRTITMDGKKLTFDGSQDVIIQSDGKVGIGTSAPSTQLEVDNGTVRFSTYGAGANTGTNTYILGVDSDGNVIEVPITSSGTDDQKIDEFSLSGTTLSISLEGDGEANKTVDLAGLSTSTHIGNSDLTLGANRTLTMDGKGLTFDGTTDIVIESSGELGIGTASPNAPLHIYEATGTSPSASDGSLIIEHGNSGGTSSIVFFSTVNPESDYGFISFSDDASGNGSTSENGLLTIGIENDVAGTYQDDIAILPSGYLGIGTTTPDAFFDVDGGSIRFSDYGGGNNAGTIAYYLAVDTDGDVIEVEESNNSSSDTRVSQIYTTAYQFNGSDQDDLSLSGLTTSPYNEVYRINATSDTDLTGIDATGVIDGQRVTLLNIGTKKIKLKDDDNDSSGGNRLLLPKYGDTNIEKGGFVTFIYDATSSAWRVFGMAEK